MTRELKGTGEVMEKPAVMAWTNGKRWAYSYSILGRMVKSGCYYGSKAAALQAGKKSMEVMVTLWAK